MKKQILGGLIAFILCAGLSLKAKAADQAEQAITGVLASYSDINFYDGTILTTINVSTGNLSVALNPTFEATNNDGSAKNLSMTASVETDDSGTQNAFYHIGTDPYIILANTSNEPILAALTDIKGGTPSAPLNPNAIAYQIDTGNTTNSNGNITYNTGTEQYDLTANTGKAYITLTTTTAAVTETYCPLDTQGNYSATITVTFL